MTKKLGILLLSEPNRQDMETVLGLCRAALRADVEVEIFLMSDAVFLLENNRWKPVLEVGAKISFCSLNTIEWEIDTQPAEAGGIESGSQYTLACIAETCDRFLAFT